MRKELFLYPEESSPAAHISCPHIPSLVPFKLRRDPIAKSSILFHQSCQILQCNYMCNAYGFETAAGKEIREDSHSTVAVVSTSMAVPSARHSSMMGIDIPLPSQDPEEPTSEGNPSDFRWSSYALDESGNEVEELSYLSKFNKRFNKVR